MQFRLEFLKKQIVNIKFARKKRNKFTYKLRSIFVKRYYKMKNFEES